MRVDEFGHRYFNFFFGCERGCVLLVGFENCEISFCGEYVGALCVS